MTETETGLAAKVKKLEDEVAELKRRLYALECANRDAKAHQPRNR